MQPSALWPALAACAVILLVLWIVLQIDSGSSSKTAATDPQASNGVSTSTVGASFGNGSGTTPAATTNAPNPTGPIGLRANGPCFVLAFDQSGQVVYIGVLGLGDTRSFTQHVIQFSLGDAGAVTIYKNGIPQGPAGQSGEAKMFTVTA